MISVVRRDLPSGGYMATQSSHALLDFAAKYPADFLQWHKGSNYLAQLSIENEEELQLLMEKAIAKGIKVVPFYEPDMDNQLTAICLEASDQSRKVTSSLPLMLKQPRPEMALAV